MAKLNLDVTGLTGLAPKFAGDLNDTTAQPQLRYLGVLGQMADGIYDPLRVQGYLSPANNTFGAITGTPANELTSSLYVEATDTVYFAQNGTDLSTISTLSGTSITNTTFLSESSQFRDIELYEVNDVESVFFTYLNSTPTTNNIPNLNLGFTTTDTTKGAFQLAALVFESLDLTNTAGEPITSTSNTKLSQTFFASQMATARTTRNVSGVRLCLQMPFVGTAQTWNLTVSIQTDSGGNPSGTPVTNGSVTVASSTIPIGAYGYLYFTFPATVALTSGSTYHLVIEASRALIANEGVYWLSSYGNNSQYTSGTTQKYDGSAWNQASLYSESFDFALILNQNLYVGESAQTISVDYGYVVIGTNASTGYSGSGTTLSYSQTTISRLNSCILVSLVVVNASDIVTAATCGGVAMTLIRKQATTATGLNSWMYFYAALGVTAGAHTIAFTTSGSTVMTAMSNDYYDVNQTTPVDGLGTTSTTNTNPFSWTVGITAGGSVPISLAKVTGGAGPITAGTAATYIRAQSGSDTTTALIDSNVLVVAVPVTYPFQALSGSLIWQIMYGYLQPPTLTTTTTTSPAITQADTNTFLHSAQNGLMYWFTGNRVHRYDGSITGYNYVTSNSATSGYQNIGTFTADVLLFPSYFKAVDAVDYNSAAYIGIESSSVADSDTREFPANYCGIYTWDYQSILATIRNYYPITGARNIKRIFLNADGDIRLITIGGNKFTEVRGLINGNFDILYTLGLNAYPVRRDAFGYLDNVAVWLGADGFFYALGKISPIAGAKEQVYKIGDLSSLAVGTLTPDVFIVGNNNSGQSRDGLIIAYNDSTAGKKLVRWYPHGVGTIGGTAQKGHAGNVYSMVLQFPTLGKINYIRLYHAPVGTASTTVKGTIKTFVNQSTTASRTDNITAKDIAKGYQYIKLGQALTSGVFALQFEMSWATGQTLDTTADWMPRYIEVDYDEITKLF